MTNKSRYPIIFSWDLSAYQAPNSPLHAKLSLTPAEAPLEPGERCVCKLTMEAGLQPQLFESELQCAVHVDEEWMMEQAAAMQAAGAGATAGGGGVDGEEVVEEVIMEDPPRSVWVMGVS